MHVFPYKQCELSIASQEAHGRKLNNRLFSLVLIRLLVHLVQHPVLYSKHFILVIDLDWNQSTVESYLQIFLEFNFLECVAAWYSKSVEVFRHAILISQRNFEWLIWGLWQFCSYNWLFKETLWVSQITKEKKISLLPFQSSVFQKYI